MMDAIIPLLRSRGSKKKHHFFLGGARPGCRDGAGMVQNAYMRLRWWWVMAWDGSGMTKSQLGMPRDASGPSNRKRRSSWMPDAAGNARVMVDTSRIRFFMTPPVQTALLQACA